MSSKLPWILEKQRIRSRMEERVFTRGSKRKREVLVRAREGEFRGSWRSLPICINTCPRATSWWEHDSYPERNRGGTRVERAATTASPFASTWPTNPHLRNDDITRFRRVSLGFLYPFFSLSLSREESFSILRLGEIEKWKDDREREKYIDFDGFQRKLTLAGDQGWE